MPPLIDSRTLARQQEEEEEEDEGEEGGGMPRLSGLLQQPGALPDLVPIPLPELPDLVPIPLPELVPLPAGAGAQPAGGGGSGGSSSAVTDDEAPELESDFTPLACPLVLKVRSPQCPDVTVTLHPSSSPAGRAQDAAAFSATSLRACGGLMVQDLRALIAQQRGGWTRRGSIASLAGACSWTARSCTSTASLATASSTPWSSPRQRCAQRLLPAPLRPRALALARVQARVRRPTRAQALLLVLLLLRRLARLQVTRMTRPCPR